MEYRNRIADLILPDYLAAFGALIVEGARATGKTSTALRHAASSVRLDRSPELVELARLSPDLVLAGDTPRVIDEWQLAPSLWNSVRHEVDDRQVKGQFILSGSAVPADDVTRHTGAGRFGRIRMRTMALAESGDSSAAISFSDLLAGEAQVGARSSVSYRDLASLAVRGGWPGLLDASESAAELVNAGYLEDLVRSDIPGAVGVRHEPVRLKRLVQSLARNLATETRLSVLADDVNADGGTTSAASIRSYLDALTQIFAIEPLPAWTVELRSRSRLRTAAKNHLVS